MIETVTISNGDCLNVLRELRAHKFIDLTLTSPPYYNAREYSKFDSYKNYLLFMRDVFAMVYNSTNDGRYCIVNTSPVIEPRTKRSTESKRYGIPFDIHSIMIDIGWDFIDDFVWIKPEGSVKNRVGGFSRHRKPLAYKPNSVTEYFMVYRKNTNGLIDKIIKNKKAEVSKSIIETLHTSNVLSISPSKSKDHPAIMPKSLSDFFIKHYSLIGDMVFDPFTGIGTTGISAVSHGRNFFGVEKNSLYCSIATENVNMALSKFNTINGDK